MRCFLLAIIFTLATASTSATLSGPFLFWGHDKVSNLQPRALVEASEQDFANLFTNVKAIIIFIRNETGRLDGVKYPEFQKLVKSNAWAYLPQRQLAAEPFNFNANIEVINLSGAPNEEDIELINGYSDAVSAHGVGEVLGILANRDDDNLHDMRKREAKDKDKDDEDTRTTTAQTPTDETEDSFIYIADGNKAILYVSAAPVLNITNAKESIKLVQHTKAINFDDQEARGYGRLNIIFKVDGEKVFLRFNFTINRGTWSMKAVEVEYKEYKTILPIVGDAYNIPSAPKKFSYSCTARQMIFRNGNDSLALTDIQVQPWLNGAQQFGEAYNCVGFTSAPIWAGVLVSLFLCSILSLGLVAILEIKAPNRFESSRSKQLTINVPD